MARAIRPFRFLLPATLAVLLAAAGEVTLSAAGGYFLRTEVQWLVAAEVALVSLVVLPVYGVLYATRWIPRSPALTVTSPRACVLAAAWAPIALTHRYLLPLSVQACAVVVLVLLGVVEARWWRQRMRWALAFAAAVVGVVGLELSATLLLPGLSQLTGPPRRRGPPPSVEAPNLVLIVLDTLRADHLGAYGYSRPTSPWLDSFAKGATVFDRAVAASSYTLPSHATLFTGLYPRSHGADVAPDPGVGISLRQLGLQQDWAPVMPLSAQAVTLAEIAHAAGLETAAICANTAYLSRHFGLDQGFATYVDTPGSRIGWRPAGLSLGVRLLGDVEEYVRSMRSNERYYLRAPEVNALAVRWLRERRERRFFLFLNYMEPHEPNLPMGGYRRLFGATTAQGREGPPQQDDPTIRAYDAEIRFLDDQLGLLFAQLEAWALLERTVIVLVGDHGESFGEHGKTGHGVTVYEPELHVPLVLRLPQQHEGRRVEAPVHLVDVMPTMLEAAHLPVPPGLQGTSLLDGGPPSPVIASLGRYEREYSEYATYSDPWKLISRIGVGGGPELYDIHGDPGERTDLAAAHPDIVERLEAALESFLLEVQPHWEATGVEIQPETLERLRALGYAN